MRVNENHSEEWRRKEEGEGRRERKGRNGSAALASSATDVEKGEEAKEGGAHESMSSAALSPYPFRSVRTTSMLAYSFLVNLFSKRQESERKACGGNEEKEGERERGRNEVRFGPDVCSSSEL